MPRQQEAPSDDRVPHHQERGKRDPSANQERRKSKSMRRTEDEGVNKLTAAQEDQAASGGYQVIGLSGDMALQNMNKKQKQRLQKKMKKEQEEEEQQKQKMEKLHQDKMEQARLKEEEEARLAKEEKNAAIKAKKKEREARKKAEKAG